MVGSALNGGVGGRAHGQEFRWTHGTGPITATGNAYRGNSAPTKNEDIANQQKSSSGSTGQVNVQVPGLSVLAELVSGHTGGTTGEVVAQPIEPGTENLHVRFELTNRTEISVLRNVSVEVLSNLESIGLVPKPGFVNALRNNGSIKTDALQGGENNKNTLYIPVDWKRDVFTNNGRLQGEQNTTITANGQSGPLNAIPGSTAPESDGKTVSASDNLTYTPLYPQSAVSVGITKLDGDALSTENPPVLKVGEDAKVTFASTVTGAKGFNPVLCVKAENIEGSVDKANALGDLELFNPSSGVEIVNPATTCGLNEIEVKLPQPDGGKSLPPVSFKVTSSGGAITEIMRTKITATLKVSSQIDRGTQGNPGPREFTANTEQLVNVSPAVDIKVGTTWLKPNGTPFGGSEEIVYNDFDTEKNPIKAKISIQNVGSDAAQAAHSTVKLTIPSGWTVEMPDDKQGWDCKVANQTELDCSRADVLPGKQQTTFEFHVVSLKDALLTTTPLTITGGNASNRATTNPFDHNAPNDTVNTQATVKIPKPDFTPTLTIPDTYLSQSSKTKPFHVQVTHTGDPVRANESRVVLETADGNTISVTKPNGWQCSNSGKLLSCFYPHAVTTDGPFPVLEGTIHVANPNDAAQMTANTKWSRVLSPGIFFDDKVPANDTSTVSLTPFNTWVDAGVEVSFDKPTPNTSEDAGAKVEIQRVDGGAPLANRSKLELKVPAEANVTNGGGVSNCAKTAKGDANTPATWTCDVTQNPEKNTPVQGPTITGITGPSKTVSAKVVLNDPGLDPRIENNVALGITASAVPPWFQAQKPDLWPLMFAFKPKHGEAEFITFVTHRGGSTKPNEIALILSSEQGRHRLRIINANGWKCGPDTENIRCTYPERVHGYQRLPVITAAVDVPAGAKPFELLAETVWLKETMNGSPENTADQNPENDRYRDWIRP